MQKLPRSLIQEWLEERPSEMFLSYLPPPVSMVTLQDAGQTIHVCLSPFSTHHHLLRHRNICIFWRAAFDHAQGCNSRFTACPDSRPCLESNLRPPFQRLQNCINRLRQRLLQFLKPCKYTLLSYLSLWVTFRHSHIRLSSVRGGSYRNVPLMTLLIETGWL